MNLAQQLYAMMQANQDAMQLTDVATGTVTSAGPLEITINAAMQPLRREVLYLTEAVVEKKVPAPGGDIVINRALAAGDKVLLLRVQHGQKYIVLSRIFE